MPKIARSAGALIDLMGKSNCSHTKITALLDENSYNVPYALHDIMFLFAENITIGK